MQWVMFIKEKAEVCDATKACYGENAGLKKYLI
jgi:hypothetical protein